MRMAVSSHARVAGPDGYFWDFAASTALVGAVTIAGLLAERFAIVPAWYASPYVAMVGLIASRFGTSPALLASVLSALAYNHIFIPPKWQFQPLEPGEYFIYGSMVLVSFLAAPKGLIAVPTRRKKGAIPALPFTRDGQGNGAPVWWDVKPSGEWADDCDVGAEYARIYAEMAASGAKKPLLAWILRDMIRAGKFGGVEAGFAQAIERGLNLTEERRR